MSIPQRKKNTGASITKKEEVSVKTRKSESAKKTVPSYTHALVTREPCCSSTDHAYLPEDIPENRKQWKQTPPGTLLNILAKAELSNDSFTCLEEEIEERLTMLPPKENKEDDSEAYFAVAVDEGRLEPRSDDEDTNFEDSEDELRHELEESLEKVAASPAERSMESPILSINKGQTDEERMSLPHKLLGKSNDDLENNHGSFSAETYNEKSKQEARAT